MAPGKSSIPFELRVRTGDCSPVTAGQNRPHLRLCPGPSVPLLGRQGSQGCILDSPGESGLVSRGSQGLRSPLESRRVSFGAQEWPKWSLASCGVWREDSGLLSRPYRKRRPSSRDDGASRGFSQGAVPGWGFSRDRTGSSGRLLWCHGSQVSMDVTRGSASLLSSHGRGIEPQDASKKNSRGLSRGVAGNPGFPRLVPITSGSLAGFL